MPESLVTTKLFFPPAREGLVPRPRLMERLSAGLRGPLTLLSAPAGYGKTALLSEWCAGIGHDLPAAWISLDSGDSDLVLFLSYLAAALESVRAGLVGHTLGLLESPQSPHRRLSFVRESQLRSAFATGLDAGTPLCSSRFIDSSLDTC